MYNFSLLRKGNEVGFEVEDSSMHDQMDVAAGMFTRARTECSLQGHPCIACAPGWMDGSFILSLFPWAQTIG